MSKQARYIFSMMDRKVQAALIYLQRGGRRWGGLLCSTQPTEPFDKEHGLQECKERTACVYVTALEVGANDSTSSKHTTWAGRGNNEAVFSSKNKSVHL